jgi:hypothetical protein
LRARHCRRRVFQGNSYESIASRSANLSDTLAAGTAATAGTQVTGAWLRFHLSVLGCATSASAVSKAGTATAAAADFMAEPVTGEVRTALSGFSNVSDRHQPAAVLAIGVATYAAATTAVELTTHSPTAAALGLCVSLVPVVIAPRECSLVPVVFAPPGAALVLVVFAPQEGTLVPVVFAPPGAALVLVVFAPQEGTLVPVVIAPHGGDVTAPRVRPVPRFGAGESRDELTRIRVRKAGRSPISTVPAVGCTTLAARTNSQPINAGLQVANSGERDCTGTAIAATDAVFAAAAAAAAAGKGNFIVAFHEFRTRQVRHSAGPRLLRNHGDKTLLNWRTRRGVDDGEDVSVSVEIRHPAARVRSVLREGRNGCGAGQTHDCQFGGSHTCLHKIRDRK